MTREQTCLMGYHILQTVKKARRSILSSLDAIQAGNYPLAWKQLASAREILDQASALQNYLETSSQDLWDIEIIAAQSGNQLEADEILYETVEDQLRGHLYPICWPQPFRLSA